MKKYLVILGPAFFLLSAFAASQGIDLQPVKDSLCGKPVSVPLTDAGVP